jgi:Spy/CpxP family protein refolding chaperone
MGYVRIGYRVAVGWLTVMMVLGAGLVAAQERSKASTKQRQGWWEKEKVHSELGLSSHQASAIASIEEQNEELTKQHRKVQQQAYRDMIKLLTVGSPSEEEIAVAREALEAAWTESVGMSVDHWMKLRNELTSEQWEKLPQVAPRALQLGGFRMHGMGRIRVGEKGERPAP